VIRIATGSTGGGRRTRLDSQSPQQPERHPVMPRAFFAFSIVSGLTIVF
jgi:hypothetical protein